MLDSAYDDGNDDDEDDNDNDGSTITRLSRGGHFEKQAVVLC